MHYSHLDVRRIASNSRGFLAAASTWSLVLLASVALVYCNNSASTSASAGISADAIDVAANYDQIRNSAAFRSNLSTFISAEPSKLFAGAGDTLKIGKVTYAGLAKVIAADSSVPFDGEKSLGAYLQKHRADTRELSAADFDRTFSILRATIAAKGDLAMTASALKQYSVGDMIKAQNVAAIWDVMSAMKDSNSLELLGFGSFFKAFASGAAKVGKYAVENADKLVTAGTAINCSVKNEQAFTTAHDDWKKIKDLRTKCSGLMPSSSECSKDTATALGPDDCKPIATWSCICSENGCTVKAGVEISLELPPEPKKEACTGTTSTGAPAAAVPAPSTGN